VTDQAVMDQMDQAVMANLLPDSGGRKSVSFQGHSHYQLVPYYNNSLGMRLRTWEISTEPG